MCRPKNPLAPVSSMVTLYPPQVVVSLTGLLPGLEGYTRRGARLNVDHRIGRSFDFTASAYYSQSIRDDAQTAAANPFYALQFYPIDVDLMELYPDSVRRDSLTS